LALWGCVSVPQEVRGWIANCWRNLLPLSLAVLGNRRRRWSGGQAEQLLLQQLAAVRTGDLHVQPYKIS